MSSVSFEQLKDGAWPDVPVEVTDANFDEVISRYAVVVVDTWAPWCGPCKMIAPIVEKLAKVYQGKVLFVKLNTDENPGVPTRYQIMAIPTLLFFKNGDLADTQVGFVSEDVITEKIDRLL